jgi:hypothetical protein
MHLQVGPAQAHAEAHRDLADLQDHLGAGPTLSRASGWPGVQSDSTRNSGAIGEGTVEPSRSAAIRTAKLSCPAG